MKSQREIKSYHCGREDTSGQRKRLILTQITVILEAIFLNISYQYQERFPYDI